MIEQFVGEQEARVLRASPLGAHLDAFAAESIRAGYQRFTGQIRLRVLKDSSAAGWRRVVAASPSSMRSSSLLISRSDGASVVTGLAVFIHFSSCCVGSGRGLTGCGHRGLCS